ncbi:sigma-54-dependent Fis family transcriptional regulator [Geodermatophilus sabuli]|uniref:Transcriptional regulator of acetoin/glycerol metabolism n=1 Tax=Geodermatophilus sabuli TaxID=1564158 RepID=A0A285EH83_9ACTN|nr:helix-turn-helix domain-containing protein [Geodermatophilus sabuli]MBB3083841.1 transcriptional regulator of acetoin/glycerol metabolism [Geodermatophilus sabuli]SNX98492.1 Transcriptional regulator of acetoin/glycerol metabolism [Geodermatophilus sabuli]
MTASPSAGGLRVPRTAAEWDAVRAAKAEVLTRDPFAITPDDAPGVRPEVVRSWRRSLLAGVDPAATRFPVDDGFAPGTRLAAVAQPILDRLADQISDLGSWGFLTDRACRLLTTVVGELPPPGRFQEMDLRPGTVFAEDVIGTNGLGCAHEEQRPFLISGTEHFRTDSEVLTTTGVIIRDPFTRRHVGTLGVHCRREYASTAVLPLVVEIGRSIEAQLLASRSDGEREFLDAYLRVSRGARGAVVGVTSRLCVVSTQARELVHEADEPLLRRLAEESGPGSGTVRRRMSSGTTVEVSVLPVAQPRGEYAAVLVLEPVDRPVGAGDGVPGEPAPGDVAARLARALADGLPVLLTGERGTGKRHIARAALRAGGAEALGTADGAAIELDGALAALDPDAWLRALVAALDGGRPALLAHVPDLPAELVPTVADLVAGARTPVVGTAPEDRGGEGGPVRLREAFPVVLPVPPLRDRRAEFPGLCRALLAALGDRDGRPATLAPRAEAALLAGDWPGNVRQLLQVLATARVRAAGPEIGLEDLPAHHRRAPAGRPLGELERLERQALAVALRETGGDRSAVAARLGISRATVYRKLKRYQLH